MDIKNLKNPCVVTLGYQDFLLEKEDALTLADIFARVKTARYNVGANGGWLIGGNPDFVLTVTSTAKLSPEPKDEEAQT